MNHKQHSHGGNTPVPAQPAKLDQTNHIAQASRDEVARKAGPICVRKTTHQKVLTFGELIAAVYNTCGKRKACAVVRLAVNAHVVVFRGRQHGVIS